MDKSYFDISEEIQLALNSHKPIVALESALISHGLPPSRKYLCSATLNEYR